MQAPPPRSSEEEKRLIERLDYLVSKSDKTRMADIYEYQEMHLQYMVQKYNRFIGQFETFFCCLEEYSRNINYLKRNWPASRGLQFIIATLALKQLHSCFILLNKGAYEDSITVLRSAYESFVRIVFISMYPESAGNVYDRHPKLGRGFKVTNVIKNDLRLDWTKYNIMSVFAHSNSFQAMGLAIEIGINKKPTPVQLTYEKDDDMIGLIINFMNFLITAYLSIYAELFTVDLSQYSGQDSKVIHSHVEKLNEYAAISREAMRTHKESEYMRKTAIDLENIVSMMTQIDSSTSKDWKSIWATIRST